MNVPTGTTAAPLAVKTSQDHISVPALKDTPSYQTGRLAKVEWKNILLYCVTVDYRASFYACKDKISRRLWLAIKSISTRSSL